MNSNTEPLTADPDILRAWLAPRFEAPGLVSLCSKNNWTGIQTDDLDRAVTWAMAEDRAGAEGIYCRVTTVTNRFSAGSRGSARDSHALLGMWSDIDFGNDLHKAKDLPATADEARDIPRFAKLPEPTRVEHSGAGLYAWWEFDQPLVIGEDISYDAATQLAADWQNILLLGAKKLGVGYGTGVKDLARVLGAVGTINRKPGREPAMRRVIEDNGTTYSLDAMLELAAALKPKPKPAPARTAPEPRAATTAAGRSDGPGPIEILGNHPCCGEILSFVGCTYHQQEPGSCSYCGGDCQQWLRPGWATGASTTGISVHKGGAAVTVRTDNFPGFDQGSLSKVLSPGMLFAALHHGGDLGAAAIDIRRAANGNPKASAAANALPAEVLDDVRTTSRTNKAQYLRSVPAPRTEAPIDGANALQPDVTPNDDSGEEKGTETTPEKPPNFPYHTVFGLPEGIKTPTGYKTDSRGVWVKRGIGDSEVEVRFAFSPLVVTATFEDPEGNQYIELSWLDRSLTFTRKISRIVSRETAKRGRKLIEQLGAAGLPAVEGDARVVEKWLAEFEASNIGKIPAEKLARWLGWQDDGSFVCSPEDGTKVDVVYEEMRGPAKAHGRKGTLEGWKEAVKPLANYPVPRVAIAAGLAAVLLKPLGLNSFTLDISSRSTKGKTTCLQCALSIWADPSEHASAMSNWRTTLYAIEKRLNLVRGIVTVFDETMAVTDDSLIDEVLYQLPMNHGKARSGGAFGNMLPWETILLSSGERPALSFTTSQGAAARILGTTISPFGENGGEAAFNAREGVLANHGHAGPEFVSYIIERLAAPGGRDALRARHKELTESFKGDSNMTGRRAPMVAVLVLAELTACRIGLLPYEPMPIEKWQKLFTAHNPTDNRPEMAMDVLREHVAGHSWELWSANRHPEDKPPFQGWLGVLSEAKDGTTRVALLPSRVKKILADAGYSLDAVVDSWVDAGYLDTLESQRPKYLVPRRFDGMRPKCLSFTTTGINVRDTADEAA
ncbi:DUF927 domain-containing protein [Streptomyces sp. NPDC005576]|uniref:DUF927 domain-containing protein n=1 Tax=Streptomyces sp. NPDC005576 TaxID=3364726 RepID=UPI0036A9B1F0